MFSFRRQMCVAVIAAFGFGSLTLGGGRSVSGGGELDPIRERAIQELQGLVERGNVAFACNVTQSCADFPATNQCPQCDPTFVCPNDASVWPNGTDPVEVRAAAMGIVLDGNVADGLAVGGANRVDTTPDEGNTPAGVTGDRESPRRPAGNEDPNGFNIARSVLFFAPDSDPLDGEDDSFVYVGFNISDDILVDPEGDGLRPRQYDSDDNDSAANLGACNFPDSCAVSDDLPESYTLNLRACGEDTAFNPPPGQDPLDLRNPFSIVTQFDGKVLMLLIGNCAAPLSTSNTPGTLSTKAFPTADGITNLDNECVDFEVDDCGAGNDVEVLIRHVETSGAFGPNKVGVIAPDSAAAKQNRFALARLIANLRGASSGDESDEESANVALARSLPEIEVKKEVRCADLGQTTFTEGPVEALIGSKVEYRITVTNLGNADLSVTMNDVLNEIGGQAQFAGCDVVCDSFAAALTSPRRGIAGLAITPANAGGAPVCAGLGDPTCLNQNFFFNSCNAPAGVSFLEGVFNGVPAPLGTLLGGVVQRSGQNNATCVFTAGDSLVITFEATVGLGQGDTVEQFCSNFVEGDCRNAVSVTGTLTSGGGVVAQDQANVADTVTEQQNGNEDDNVVNVDIVCRDIDFVKEVGFPADEGSFVTELPELNLPSIQPGQFLDLEFRYTSQNLGEVIEQITINDAALCADITATNVAVPGGITLLNCPLCPGGSVGPTAVNPGGFLAAECIIRFNSQAALRNFLGRDEADPGCGGGPAVPADEDEDCYQNCASATTTTSNFGNICRPPSDQFTRTSYTRVCNRPCEIEVTKEVRCLPTCSPTSLGAEVGWVSDPAELEVTPGACVQYRIRVTNTSDSVPLCALKLNDLMSNAGNFSSGPSNVQVSGDATCLGLAAGFNILGNDVCCNTDLGPGEQITLLFQAVLAANANPAQSPENVVNAFGAGEGSCLTDDCTEASYSCEADDSVRLDIQRCDYTLTKDVTCDEPRLGGGALNPAAVWKPDLTDALPGSEVAFRVQVCNTGDTDVLSINLNDILSCNTWYVAGSVVGDIAGTDVTSCLCPGGVCANIGQLNGNKNLGVCRAGGIRSANPDECLTITFKVRVPANFVTEGTAVDCNNSMTVQGTTDVCQSSTQNPCPSRNDTAAINVLVPGIECLKEVCADLNNNGNCNDAGDVGFTTNLNLPCDVAFPFRLIYRVTVTNTGETGLQNVEVCDQQLVSDASAAGLSAIGCGLNAVTGCANIGALAANGGSNAVSCGYVVDNRGEFEAFAASDTDGSEGCYENTATVEADVNANNLCTRLADTDVNTDCSARVCLAPPCDVSVTKGFRCVNNCSSRTPVGELVDVLEATEGATVEFEVRARNDGDEDICALRFEDELTGPFTLCPGTAPAACRVTLVSGGGSSACNVPSGNILLNGNPFTINIQQACGSVLDPGEELVIRCAGTIPNGAAGTVQNTVRVECAPDDGRGCTVGNPIFCGNEDEDDAEVRIRECEFTVEKDVKCEEDATYEADALADALPGSVVDFRVQVCNTGQVSMPRVTLSDALTCNTWFVPGSVTATIGATNVTSCICPGGVCANVGQINGTKNLIPCDAGGIGVGECLTINFKVAVPGGFSQENTPIDCTNTITVTGATDVCSSSTNNPCGQHDDSARINVHVPSVECDKAVCLDRDADGNCDTGYTPNLDEQDAAFPLRLTYRMSVTNDGETDLSDVQICDLPFRTDAGPYILACDIPGGGCVDIGDLAQGASSVDIECTLHFETDADYQTFALSDGGDEECYRNTASVTATPDTDGEICESDITVNSGCSAQVCVGAPDCKRELCPPVVKAFFEVFNENESKLSGLERCIDSWDARLLSEYTDGYFFPNYFLRNLLGTTKGQARIDGMRSVNVCGADSIDAPLIGIATKILAWGALPQDQRERAAMSLVGMDAQAGVVYYEPRTGGGGEGGPEIASAPIVTVRPEGGRVGDGKSGDGRSADDETRGLDPSRGLNPNSDRATISEKGSFLSFPRVEVKLDAAGRLIQDTIIGLYNDGPMSVDVQTYLIDGDQCVFADAAFTLTKNQPTYWSVFTGQPQGANQFPSISPGCRDTDPLNPGGRIFRGYLILWAVDPSTLNEIRFNHLKGEALVINYAEGSAYEYNAWAFGAIAGGGINKAPLLPPFGQLDFDGIEYDAAPDKLLLDFYSSGTILEFEPGQGVSVDTDLTLWAVWKDLRLNVPPPPP